MFKASKKSVLVVYSILSTFLTYIPIAYAQDANDLVNPLKEAITLAFGLVSGLLQAIIDSINKDPFIGRIILAIIITMILYD